MEAKKPKPKRPIRAMFACNDYRNGMSQGWFDSVVIEKYEAELDGPQTRLTFLTRGEGCITNRVRIGRKIFEHDGVAEWVGNWCWDEIRIVDGRRLLEHLRSRGFTCSVGHTKFFEWFNTASRSS
jgi:hypothetical protein